MLYTLLLQDITEIVFYAFIIYLFCVWLKTDKTKNILAYFLTYCLLMVISWVIELPTLYAFLWTYAPVATMLFILIHEKTLQRNLITLRTITPVNTPQEDWLDVLLSSILAMMNHNKSIIVVIENKDSLEHFLTTPFLINAYLTKGILHILLSSNSYEEYKMVWVDIHGRIRGINTLWTQELTTQAQKTNATLHKANALFYTLQSDALVVQSCSTTRSFSLIMQGKEFSNISSHTIKTTIKNHLSSSASQKKERSHAHTTTEKSLF